MSADTGKYILAGLATLQRMDLPSAMTLRTRAALAILAVGLSALLWSCERAAPEQSEQTTPASQSRSALTADEVALLDKVTTLETVLPDASERALYMTQEAGIENGRRSYSFALERSSRHGPVPALPAHHGHVGSGWHIG